MFDFQDINSGRYPATGAIKHAMGTQTRKNAAINVWTPTLEDIFVPMIIP